MIPVALAPGAERDLIRLADFLSQKNRRAADGAVVAINQAILSLSEFPERGPWSRTSMRVLSRGIQGGRV